MEVIAAKKVFSKMKNALAMQANKMTIRQIHGPKIDVNGAEILLMKNEWSYAGFIGSLSSPHMKAHASAALRSSPYRLAIVINEAMAIPYRGQPDSSFERLVALLRRMKEPAGGIEVGIFVADGIFGPESPVGLKHSVSQCWPLECKGTKTDITANLPPAAMDNEENRGRYFASLDLDATRIDYQTPIHQVFATLDKSRVHVSYQGGTGWLSVCMGIPTIIVHPVPLLNPGNRKSRLFGQHLGEINVLDAHDRITTVSQHPMEFHCQQSELGNTLKRALATKPSE